MDFTSSGLRFEHGAALARSRQGSGLLGRQEEQQDIVGKCEISAAMIGRAVENQEDILPGKPARQDIQEALEASRVRGRHNQIDAGPVLRTNRTVQIDVFANELTAVPSTTVAGSSGRNALHRQTSPATDDRAGRPRAAPSAQRRERRFFKSVLRRKIAFGMKRPRHQLAPAMPPDAGVWPAWPCYPIRQLSSRSHKPCRKNGERPTKRTTGRLASGGSA